MCFCSGADVAGRGVTSRERPGGRGGGGEKRRGGRRRDGGERERGDDCIKGKTKKEKKATMTSVIHPTVFF